MKTPRQTATTIYQMAVDHIAEQNLDTGRPLMSASALRYAEQVWRELVLMIDPDQEGK